MAVNLQKGQKVSLVKADGKKLTKLMVGLGWDAAVQEGGFFKKLFSGKKDIATRRLLCARAASSKIRTILFSSAT